MGMRNLNLARLRLAARDSEPPFGQQKSTTASGAETAVDERLKGALAFHFILPKVALQRNGEAAGSRLKIALCEVICTS
jgi:hypothetical protein